MNTMDDDSGIAYTCPKCNHWIGVCNCPKEKNRNGLECSICKTPTLYKFGDHYKCFNPRHPKYPGSASEVITKYTKTWNDK
jgi:hypothetical protein